MTQNRWFILALLFLARTAMGFQFQSVGSVGPILVDALAIEYTAVGTLIGLYMLPGVFIALPGGLLGERFGSKRVVVAGLVFMVTGGAIMAMSSSFPAVVFGRLLSGTGAVLMNVLLTKMVADWFAGREIATAMAILVTSWPLGIALGLLGFAPLAIALGWPAVMLMAAIACVPFLLGIAAIYRDPPSAAMPPAAAFKLDLTSREWLLVSIAGFVWAIYNVGYIVLVSFLPGYFTGSGYTLTQANVVVSWLGWALIAFVPLGGYLADRFARPTLIMITGCAITALATLCLAYNASPAIPTFAIIAIVVGLPAGPIMALPTQAVSPRNRAVGMGIYFTWYYALMASFPALAGLARDITQDFAASLVFAAVMMVVAIAGLLGFRLGARAPVALAG